MYRIHSLIDILLSFCVFFHLLSAGGRWVRKSAKETKGSRASFHPDFCRPTSWQHRSPCHSHTCQSNCAYPSFHYQSTTVIYQLCCGKRNRKPTPIENSSKTFDCTCCHPIQQLQKQQYPWQCGLQWFQFWAQPQPWWHRHGPRPRPDQFPMQQSQQQYSEQFCAGSVDRKKLRQAGGGIREVSSHICQIKTRDHHSQQFKAGDRVRPQPETGWRGKQTQCNG